jgi:hypothetical protein
MARSKHLTARLRSTASKRCCPVTATRPVDAFIHALRSATGLDVHVLNYTSMASAARMRRPLLTCSCGSADRTCYRRRPRSEDIVTATLRAVIQRHQSRSRTRVGELAARKTGGECPDAPRPRRVAAAERMQASGTGSPPRAGERAALSASVRVGAAELAFWPGGQSVAPLSAPLLAITNFNDHADYHPALISAALLAENDPRFRGEMFRGACGTKVRNVPGWNDSSAALSG